MNKFRFWQRWLLVVSCVITVLGIIMAFSKLTLFFELSDKQYNPIFWGAESITTEIEKFQIWNFGVLGAVVSGWGVFFIFIARYPFRQREKWSWNAIVAGSILWFVIDTSYSIYYLVYPNIALNIILFVVIILPLIFTRKEFIKG